MAVPVSVSRLLLSLISRLQQRIVLKCLLFLGQWKILETIRQCLNKIWCQKGRKEGRKAELTDYYSCSSWGTDRRLNSRTKFAKQEKKLWEELMDAFVVRSPSSRLFSAWAATTLNCSYQHLRPRCVVPQHCQHRSICACRFQD